MLDRLTYFDAKKGELVPWIASKFTASEDQTKFTFTIRPGVTFSDGTRLIAKAVQANFEALGKGIESAKIQPNVDFLHLQVLAGHRRGPGGSNPVPPDANFLAPRPPSPPDSCRRRPSPWTTPPSRPSRNLRSGPFTFESEKADEEIVLAKRSDYAWAPEGAANQGAAYLDKVVVKYLPEVATARGPCRPAR